MSDAEKLTVSADTITINDVEYVRATSSPTGTRAVVVVDRGVLR